MVKRKTGLDYETKETIINKIEALEDLSNTDLKLLLSEIDTRESARLKTKFLKFE